LANSNPSFLKCVLRIEARVQNNCAGSWKSRLFTGLCFFSFVGLEVAKCIYILGFQLDPDLAILIYVHEITTDDLKGFRGFTQVKSFFSGFLVGSTG
jgi:hypothetical protein